MLKKEEVEVGMRVTWMDATGSGRGFNLKSKKGKVIQVGERSAYIQKSGGRKEWISFRRLRKEGDKTELTELFEGLAGEKAREDKPDED